eukprot:s1139_g4.t1
MPLGYKREISFPRPAHGRGTTIPRGHTTPSGAGGLIAAAGVALDSDRRHWQPVTRPGDGKVVRLSATARTPRRWVKNEPDKDAPSLHKLMPWESRQQGAARLRVLSGIGQLMARCLGWQGEAQVCDGGSVRDARGNGWHGATFVDAVQLQEAAAKPSEPARRASTQAEQQQQQQGGQESITGIEGFQPHLQQKRRSVTEAMAGLQSDLLSHSIKPNYRYRAGMPGVWDTIQENASAKVAKMRRALMEAAERREAKQAEQAALRDSSILSVDHGKSISEAATDEFSISPLLTVVVLFFHAPCNPLNMDDILILRKARQAIEAYHQVAVAGALVIPFSTLALQKRFAGEKGAVLLPFDFRMEMAQSVIDTAEQGSWILTDNCEEGCLASAPGSLLHYFAEYTRSRLYDAGYETKVLEVRYEDVGDCLWSDGDVSKTEHRVVEDPYGLVPEVPKTANVRGLFRVLIECPKQVHCRELLRRSIWLLCRGEDTSACCDVLRRLLGASAAELLQRWASRHQEGARSKFRS